MRFIEHDTRGYIHGYGPTEYGNGVNDDINIETTLEFYLNEDCVIQMYIEDFYAGWADDYEDEYYDSNFI